MKTPILPLAKELVRCALLTDYPLGSVADRSAKRFFRCNRLASFVRLARSTGQRAHECAIRREFRASLTA